MTLKFPSNYPAIQAFVGHRINAFHSVSLSRYKKMDAQLHASAALTPNKLINL
jgi:hypothetical protein